MYKYTIVYVYDIYVQHMHRLSVCFGEIVHDFNYLTLIYMRDRQVTVSLQQQHTVFPWDSRYREMSATDKI